MNFLKQWNERRKGRSEYSKKLMSYLDDHKIDETEKQELSKVISNYNLRPKDTLGAQKKAFNWLFKQISSDQLISDEEKQKLDDLTSFFNRGIDELNFSFKQQEEFTRYRVLAQIEEGILPRINSDVEVIMKSGEFLSWVCIASSMKWKRVTKSINYGGLTGSIKIAKGVRYRVGSIKIGRVSEEHLTQEDSGFLWLSSERIGFKGARKHFTIQHSKISAFEISEGVLKIFKEGREKPYMIYLTEYDIPCSILSLILNPIAK